jgi:hypothetical protein
VRIDREGQIFRHVLSFLHPGKATQQPVTAAAVHVQQEAKYYGMHELVSEARM